MNLDRAKVYFTTVTVNNWVPVFQDFPESRGIILESFRYCVDQLGVRIYAFVLMRDHLHFVWHCPDEMEGTVVINKFKQHTGRNISQLIQLIDSSYLENFQSERKDRDHKIWKLNTSNLRIEHPDILQQKIKYIHLNPTLGQYKSVDQPEEYLLSSARAYLVEVNNFSFLTILRT